MTRERLQSYSVHERPHLAADRVERAEALEFVKDGFVRAMVLLPPVWLAVRGVWLGVLAYAAAASAIVVVSWLLLLPPIMTLLAFLALHLIFATEADEMLRAHLAARGWTTVGHITGTGRLDCERRFYDNWLASAPVTTTTSSTSPTGRPIASNATALQGRGMSGRGILGNLLAPLKFGRRTSTK